MKKHRLVHGVAAFLGMLILIMDGKTALNSGREGILLCLITVIPSLFPFFVLSNLLTNTLPGSNLSTVKKLCRQLHFPSGAESILIPAFLGGYPAGAQSIAQAYQQGWLDRRDAEHLLSFCSNAGPAFLFGMAAMQFQDKHSAWLLWLIHILSALAVGRMLPFSPGNSKLLPQKNITISESVTRAIHTMASVCGWILLFRVIMGFLQRWILWILPKPVQAAITGIMELSNGCLTLSLIENESWRFIVCSGMLAFGGLCVLMQTISVCKELSIGWYLRGKLLQTAFSLLLSVALIHGGWALLPCTALLLLLPPGVFKKRGSIPEELSV